jgi:hyperosmotically inducible periplasmic protein
MKTSLKSYKFASVLALLGTLTLGTLTLGVLAGGCASTPTSDSTGEYVDDTIITTKVKSALLGDDEVKSFAISVETVKGVVQLSGFVNSSKQRSAADRAAWKVKGVKEVKNDLIVK